MMKNHQESTYRDRERKQNRESKQKMRNDTQVKEKETALKRQKRSDPLVKEKETEHETKEEGSTSKREGS